MARGLCLTSCRSVQIGTSACAPDSVLTKKRLQDEDKQNSCICPLSPLWCGPCLLALNTLRPDWCLRCHGTCPTYQHTDLPAACPWAQLPHLACQRKLALALSWHATLSSGSQSGCTGPPIQHMQLLLGRLLACPAKGLLLASCVAGADPALFMACGLMIPVCACTRGLSCPASSSMLLLKTSLVLEGA